MLDNVIRALLALMAVFFLVLIMQGVYEILVEVFNVDFHTGPMVS